MRVVFTLLDIIDSPSLCEIRALLQSGTRMHCAKSILGALASFVRYDPIVGVIDILELILAFGCWTLAVGLGNFFIECLRRGSSTLPEWIPSDEVNVRPRDDTQIGSSEHVRRV